MIEREENKRERDRDRETDRWGVKEDPRKNEWEIGGEKKRIVVSERVNERERERARESKRERE